MSQKARTWHFDPPAEASKIIEALTQERKNKPYIVMVHEHPYTDNIVSAWERDKKGNCSCVYHSKWKGAIGRESNENSLRNKFLSTTTKLYYCDKKELFLFCI